MLANCFVLYMSMKEISLSKFQFRTDKASINVGGNPPDQKNVSAYERCPLMVYVGLLSD